MISSSFHSPPQLQLPSLTKLIRILYWVKDGPLPGLLDALILEHLAVHAHIVALDGQSGFGGLSFDDEVVIAVRAVLVTLVHVLGVLAETFLAFLAGERHVKGLEEVVGFLLVVALCAVEPLAACRIIKKVRSFETCAYLVSGAR
jgi:hypothetical protein